MTGEGGICVDRSQKVRRRLALLPARVISLSFLAVIGVGTALLMLPVSSQDGRMTAFADALFTATSATCVTGLIVFDTATKWSAFGQMVILCMIQIGGLGLVTFTTFFNILLGKKLGLRSMQLAQESISSSNGFEDIRRLVRMVVTASLLIELAGACLYAAVLVPEYGVRGVFMSIFTAVSAFCNAGMDLFGFEEPFISLCGFYSNPVILFTTMLLIVIGGLGFMVWADLYNYRKRRSLSLHSRVVLTMTGALILLGTAVVLLFEWSNPNTIGEMDPAQKALNALFQSVTTRTAGFNTFDNAAMNGFTKLFCSFLMFVGAAPGSTGGGLKVTTIAVVLMTVVCVSTGRDDTVIMKRKVSKQVVYKALAILVIAVTAVGVGTLVVISTVTAGGEPVSGLDAFYESVSAFSTAGLSVGITGHATLPSKLVLIALMFLGRVGPVSFALSLAMRPPMDKTKVIPEGKIMVG